MLEMLLLSNQKKVISQWGQLPKLLAPTYAASMVYHSGNIYSFGGYNQTGVTAIDSITKYDIATNVTTTLSPFPAPRSGIAVARVGDKIYLCCGDGYGKAPHDMYEFDTLTETLTRLADPIKDVGNGSYGSSSFANVNGILYLAGSVNQNGMHQKYDPATDTWTRLKNTPIANMYNGTYVNLGNSNYYIAGSPSTTSVYRYDILLDTWTKQSDLPMPSGYTYKSCVINNIIYVVAMSSNGNPYVVLSFTGTSWTLLTNNTAPSGYGDSSITSDGFKIYISGGQKVVNSTRILSDLRITFTPGV